MTLVTLPTDLYYPRPLVFSGTAPAVSQHQVVDAAGEYASYVFRARENMVLSHVGFYIITAAGTMDIRIETVDATTGSPTGALWATNTNLSFATSIGWNLVALTAAATINKDDWYVIKWAFVTASRTALLLNWSGALNGSAIPYQAQNAGTDTLAVTTVNGIPLLALGSSTTTFYSIPQIIATNATFARTINNTSAGRIGIRFQVPFKCRCRGLQYGQGTPSDIKVMIMSDAGSELSSSQLLFDGNIRQSGIAIGDYHFANPVTLAANTWYRAVIEPQTATNVTMYTYTLPSADYAETSWWGPNKAHYTTYTSGGGWIDTATTEFPRMAIILDQLDDGVGGGGLIRHPGMAGGLNA